MTTTLPHSDALVFFGATGDLAYKQIFPALQALARRGRLNVPVIGVAKAGWTIDQLRARAKDSVEKHGGLDSAGFAALMSRLQYIDGDYNDPSTYTALRTALGDSCRPLHYLAIPPALFATVAQGLGRAGCASDARVVVEKPFGHDLESAEALNATLHSVFDERNIFRIDHFLGKEAVEDLLIFRFANTLFEPVWTNEFIDSIQITMAESFGVAGRGGFYEQAGAIRDVIQNHLLEVVGFLTMEAPEFSHSESLSDEQMKIFAAIRPLRPEDVVRGQASTYRGEREVSPTSTVETYAAVRLAIDTPRWRGVPILIRAGKYLATTATEVLVKLKRPPRPDFSNDEPNYVRFRVSPDMRIGIGARVKRSGETMTSEGCEFVMVHRVDGEELQPYERLIGEAMAGDNMLFAREDCVEAAWKVVEPILGNVTPLYPYNPGTWGPAEADQLSQDIGGWHDLSE